jgi:hypothetical protein
MAGRVAVGDGLAAAEVEVLALAGATDGLLEELPALAAGAGVRAARELARRVGWAYAACEPAKASSATPTAAMTHSPTAPTTIALPGWARIPDQLRCLIVGETLVDQIDPARRATRQRYATASSVVEVQQLKTWSRSSGGSGASGSSRENADGRSAPQP